MNECKEFSFPKSGGGGDEGNNKEITVCELMENILQSSITRTEEVCKNLKIMTVILGRVKSVKEG